MSNSLIAEVVILMMKKLLPAAKEQLDEFVIFSPDV
jgi:hypothetical protein